jgi:hypothetical protein
MLGWSEWLEQLEWPASGSSVEPAASCPCTCLMPTAPRSPSVLYIVPAATPPECLPSCTASLSPEMRARRFPRRRRRGRSSAVGRPLTPLGHPSCTAAGRSPQQAARAGRRAGPAQLQSHDSDRGRTHPLLPQPAPAHSCCALARPHTHPSPSRTAWASTGDQRRPVRSAMGRCSSRADSDGRTRFDARRPRVWRGRRATMGTCLL